MPILPEVALLLLVKEVEGTTYRTFKIQPGSADSNKQEPTCTFPEHCIDIHIDVQDCQSCGYLARMEGQMLILTCRLYGWFRRDIKPVVFVVHEDVSAGGNSG